METNINISHNIGSDIDLLKAYLGGVTGLVPAEYPGVEFEIEDLLQTVGVLKKSFPDESDTKGERRRQFNAKFPPALRHLLRKWQGESDFMLEKLMEAVKELFRPDKLKKAVGSRHGQEGLEHWWFPITPDKLEKLRQTLEDHKEAFFYNTGVIPEINRRRLKKLKKMGIIRSEADVLDIMDNSYLLSRAVDALERGADFHNVLEIAKQRPWSKIDQMGVDWAKENVANNVRGLWRDAETKINQLAKQSAKSQQARSEFVDMAKRQVETGRMVQLRSEAVAAKRAGLTWQEFNTQLKHVWEDWARDWDRIAYTEFSYIEKNAQGQNILERDGPDQLVYKQPFPNACKYCKKMYLKPDGSPRMFTISELMQNGDNGEKWKNPRTGKLENKRVSQIRYSTKTDKFNDSSGGIMPTLGPLHPWCRCILYRYSPGYKPKHPGWVAEHPEARKVQLTFNRRIKAHFAKEQAEADAREFGKAVVRGRILVKG